jgi:TatD DNase family protein
VKTFLNISTKRSEWGQVVGTAEREPDVYASVGIHPHHADDHQDLTEAQLREATKNPRVIGIGETGLDYYYEHSDRAAQQRLFRLHIAVARDVQLPVIIHTRDAEDDTLAILEDELGKGAFPALIHCFTASAEFGEAVLALGLSISISGIVTFKNAKDLQGVARDRSCGPAAGRNRQSLSRASAASRSAVRAGLRARYRSFPRRASR